MLASLVPYKGENFDSIKEWKKAHALLARGHEKATIKDWEGLGFLRLDLYLELPLS